jgi:hypothetical protein
MTPKQFNELDEQEQAEVIWEGKHIGDRQDEEYSILLYEIEADFYVEVYLHKVHNVIHKFMAYREHELLDIYLPKN